MEQTFATKGRTDAVLDGWMSVEELAEERWERAPAWRRKPSVSAEITEDDLPF